MSSAPKHLTLADGRKVVKFSLITTEKTLDSKGNLITKKDHHLLSAWGKWIKVIEKIKDQKVFIAIEGKIITRFYFEDGKRRHISEIEINDLLFVENSSCSSKNAA